jgi:hypothetical protein
MFIILITFYTFFIIISLSGIVSYPTTTSYHDTGVTLPEPFQTDRLDGTLEVWEMPSNHVRKCGHYNTSLSFPSPELAVLADGAGTLHVVSTGIRFETTAWKVSWPLCTSQGYVLFRVEVYSIGVYIFSRYVLCYFAYVIILDVHLLLI